MPRIEATCRVNAPIDVAFAVSQTTGDVRLLWDPFIQRQRFLDEATEAGKGVRTETISKHRLRMVSQYVSYRPPKQVGMKMVEGPWFFETFSGGWTFRAAPNNTTDATWRYSFKIKPAALAPVADRIGSRVLRRDIERRLAAFAKGCEDPAVLAAVRD